MRSSRAARFTRNAGRDERRYARTLASERAQGSSVFQVARCGSPWKSPLATAGSPASATQAKSVSRLKSSKRSTSGAHSPGSRGERAGAAAARRRLVERIRVGGDERRPVRACGAQCRFEPAVDADEAAQPDRDARGPRSAGSGSS